MLNIFGSLIVIAWRRAAVGAIRPRVYDGRGEVRVGERGARVG